jgi:hypothetical protein
MRRPRHPRPESRSHDSKRRKEGKSKSMDTTGANEAMRSPGAGILALPEEDLAQRCYSKVFVEVPEGSGSNRKEIGDLSQAEIKVLEPGLRIRVVNRLLERYLAEHGHFDLLKERHPYTKNIRNLAPANLSALLEADQEKGRSADVGRRWHDRAIHFARAQTPNHKGR